MYAKCQNDIRTKRKCLENWFKVVHMLPLAFAFATQRAHRVPPIFDRIVYSFFFSRVQCQTFYFLLHQQLGHVAFSHLFLSECRQTSGQVAPVCCFPATAQSINQNIDCNTFCSFSNILIRVRQDWNFQIQFHDKLV